MQNFVFHNPTKIIFGKDTISNIGSETAPLTENNKVLLVYGTGSIKHNTIYEQVISSFKEAQVEWIEHPGVQSNPLLSHVKQGIELAKKHNCTAVCAVGGGSVLDEAKAICAGTTVNHDVWKFFTGKKSVKNPLPLTTVLTLAASGSEMNTGMVITNDDTRQKFGFANKKLSPKASILDPCATFTVPADYTAYGAIDAIAHVLEFYFTTRDPSTPVQDRFMEGLIINAMDSCNRVLKNLEDYQARADLMWTATLALNGLTGAGLGKVGFPMHLIEHSLSALYNVPHGAGLSVVIPGWMNYQATLAPARFAQFGRRIFDLQDGTDEQIAFKAIAALKNWFNSVNCPTSLTQLSISRQEIPAIAKNALPQAKIWRMQEYDQKIIEDILDITIQPPEH